MHTRNVYNDDVRRRISSIWVMLALVPYLGLSMLGDFGHTHGCCHIPTATTLHFMPGGAHWLADKAGCSDDKSSCPCCLWQQEAVACAALIPAAMPLSCPETPRILGRALQALPLIFSETPARAPPALSA